MPILVAILMMVLALAGAIYVVENRLKRSEVGSKERPRIVLKLLATAYLPLVLWLLITVAVLHPLLPEGLWLMISFLIGTTWVIGVFAIFRRKYFR